MARDEEQQGRESGHADKFTSQPQWIQPESLRACLRERESMYWMYLESNMPC